MCNFIFSIWPWLILDPLAAWTLLVLPFYTLHQALQMLVLLKYYDRGASGFSSGGGVLTLLFRYFLGFGRSMSFSSVFLSCSLLSGEQEGHSFL